MLSLNHQPQRLIDKQENGEYHSFRGSVLDTMYCSTPKTTILLLEMLLITSQENEKIILGNVVTTFNIFMI